MDKNCGGTLACRYSKVFSLQLSAHLLELMLLSTFSPHAKWSFYPIDLSHHLSISLSISYVTHTMWVWQDPFSKSLKSILLNSICTCIHTCKDNPDWVHFRILPLFAVFINQNDLFIWDSPRLCWYNISGKKKKKFVWRWKNRWLCIRHKSLIVR